MPNPPVRPNPPVSPNPPPGKGTAYPYTDKELEGLLARVAGEALAALGVPALVFNETGKVLAANPLIEALTGFVRWRAFDRVSLKDRGAHQLLRDAVATIDSESTPGVRSFPARDAEAEATRLRMSFPSGFPHATFLCVASPC
jgi:PAS domain-containing protein